MGAKEVLDGRLSGFTHQSSFYIFHSSFFIPLYLGPAAQLSFSARLCHSRAEGFSTSSASCRLRRMTTRSPAHSDVVACPSQKSVVPLLTRCATITTVEREEITTG